MVTILCDWSQIIRIWREWSQPRKLKLIPKDVRCLRPVKNFLNLDRQVDRPLVQLAWIGHCETTMVTQPEEGVSRLWGQTSALTSTISQAFWRPPPSRVRGSRIRGDYKTACHYFIRHGPTSRLHDPTGKPKVWSRFSVLRRIQTLPVISYNTHSLCPSGNV